MSDRTWKYRKLEKKPDGPKIIPIRDMVTATLNAYTDKSNGGPMPDFGPAGSSGEWNARADLGKQKGETE